MTVPSCPFIRRLLPGLLLGGLALGAAAQAPLPNAEAAFAPSASIPAPGRIEVTFHVQEGYALYRGSVHVTVTTPGVMAGALALPRGKSVDEGFGLGTRQELHGTVAGTLDYSTRGGAALPASVEISVRFQGCRKQAPQICYPPATHVFHLFAVRANTTGSTDKGFTSGGPVNDWGG